MKTFDFFKQLIDGQKVGKGTAVCSICSANALVLEAAMEDGRDNNQTVLIEATANQVNQFGGYTGMTPADFAGFVQGIAQKIGLNEDKLILGGDHLGPLTWRSEPAEAAMEKAQALVSAYVSAGFTKIHLDTSMKLGDDSKTERLSDSVIAKRAAILCAEAEASATDFEPVYVIGSEVPVPGGATENEDAVAVTEPGDLDATVGAFKCAFADAGLSDAWQRVIAVVVQPGVEFADNTIIKYDSKKASALTSYAKGLNGMILEGHSTDYQTRAALSKMRNDGIGILKVGPALTFALREALFSLEDMERELFPFSPDGGYSNFRVTLEAALMRDNQHWVPYYHGSTQEKAFARKYSLSDRCRYYMAEQSVQVAIKRLIHNIDAVSLPYGLISQCFPELKERIVSVGTQIGASGIIKEKIKDVILTYR